MHHPTRQRYWPGPAGDASAKPEPCAATIAREAQNAQAKCCCSTKVNQQTLLHAVKPVTRPVNKVRGKTLEDAEIVIVEKRPSPAVKPVISPAVNTPIAVTMDYKVVNVWEGTVVLRQGQAVRQVKLGEKIPDVKIFKSIRVGRKLA